MPAYLINVKADDVTSSNDVLDFIYSKTGIKLDEAKVNPDVYISKNTDINNNTIGIENVKEMTRFLMSKPVASKYKVLVVFGFDNATIIAQNAMLKMLEDSPEYVYFFLIVSNPFRILDTINSRCTYIYLGDKTQDKEVYNKLVDVILQGDIALLLEQEGLFKDFDKMLLFSMLRKRAYDVFDFIEYTRFLQVLTNAHEYSNAFLSMRDVLIYLTSQVYNIRHNKS